MIKASVIPEITDHDSVNAQKVLTKADYYDRLDYRSSL